MHTATDTEPTECQHGEPLHGTCRACYLAALSPEQRADLRADVAAAQRRRALAERADARAAELNADGPEAAAMRVALSYTSESLSRCLRGRKRQQVAERIAAQRGVSEAVALRAMVIAYRVPRWAIARALPAVADGAELTTALRAVAEARRDADAAFAAQLGPELGELLRLLAELSGPDSLARTELTL